MSYTPSFDRFSQFFDPIFGQAKGLIEIRCLPSRDQLFSRNKLEIEKFIQNHIGENVYFGVSTRKDKDGSKAGVLEVPALWADIDWKDLPGGVADANERIKAFPLKPSIAVLDGLKRCRAQIPAVEEHGRARHVARDPQDRLEPGE